MLQNSKWKKHLPTDNSVSLKFGVIMVLSVPSLLLVLCASIKNYWREQLPFLHTSRHPLGLELIGFSTLHDVMIGHLVAFAVLKEKRKKQNISLQDKSPNIINKKESRI